MATRRENVRLSYHSNLAAGLGRDAAAAALLNQELTGLNRRSGNLNRRLPTLTNNVNNLGNALGGVGGNSGLNGSLRQSGNLLDRNSGRLRLWAEAIATIGPALVPISAVAIPAITGLAAQLGFAAVAGGTAMLAFQGVGDALDTLNKARLNPTTANLEAARIAMENLSPAAQKFVKELRSMSDVGKQLRFAAQEGMFPGLTKALDTIETRVPEVERILFTLGDTVGDLMARGADSLAGDEWDEFFKFIETDARESLMDLGSAVGNTVHALGELWMAFDPLNDDFGNWMVEATQSLDDWASGLKETEGFSDFVAYIRDNGPQVAATFKAIATAALDIVTAAAPLGGPVLQAIEGIAKAISFIADSDMGTPILVALGALSLFNRTMAVGSRIAATTWAANMRGANGMHTQLAAINRAALLGGAAIGVMTLAQTGMLEQAGLTNTAMLALAGTMIGGPWGAAIGAGVGMTMDLAAANDSLEAAVSRAQLSMEQGAGADVLKRDLASLNQELEKTEKRMEFKDSSILDAWNPVGYTLDSLHNARVLAERTKDKFSDLGGEAQETRKDLEAALSGGGLADALLGPLGLTADGMDNASASTEDFIASLQKLSNILDGEMNWIDYQAAIDDVSDSLKEHGRSLDINTRAGQANKTALVNQARAALDIAATLDKADRVPFLSRARKDLVDSAAKFTKTRKEAQRLATQLGLKPQSVDIDDKASPKIARIHAALRKYGLTKAEASAALHDVASGRIKSVQKLIDKYGISKAQAKALLEDRASGALRNIISLQNQADRDISSTITTTTISKFIQHKVTPSALGGMYRDGVKTYARGGMDRANRHEPEMAGPTLRIWAEPETGGESYIPWANDHRRPRARNVLERTAGMFGGQVQWYANGGSPDLEAMPVGSGGKRMPPRLPGRQPASVLLAAQAAVAARNLDLLGLSAKRLNRMLNKSEQALEREKAQRDRLVDRRDELASTVSDKFRTDIFGERPEGFEWMSTKDRRAAMGTWKDTLKTDIANGRRFTQLLKTLKNKGLSGAAFAELAQTGDVARAEMFAQMTRAELNGYERLFNQRERVAGNTGDVAGDIRFGKAIDKQTKVVRELRDDVRDLKHALKDVGKKAGAEAGKEVAKAVKGVGQQLQAEPVRQLQAIAAGAGRNKGRR